MISGAKVQQFNEKTKRFSLKVLNFSFNSLFWVLNFSFIGIKFLVKNLSECLCLKELNGFPIDIVQTMLSTEHVIFSIFRGEGQALASSFLLEIWRKLEARMKT
ncbi:hypothetical protein DW262_15470 [Segatella copri]|uniref:Uncharacterized protein n=1 Tax=Segatella copri TaxID=165179 RepID=A0A3R6DRT3_9BACT|nr:hypothetical protein DW263_15970 [Segatella copri]RHG31163.1 hypothetical protein DW262_15470 [Segatella copri]RHG60991.1 hypothetical protein DW250_15640 [Segatella copri]